MESFVSNNEDKTENTGIQKLQSRCSPIRFCYVVQKFNNELKAAIREMGFGKLIEMRSVKIYRALVMSLVDNFDVDSSTISVYGKQFKFNSKLFEWVMGAEDGGEDCVND
ncbi:hypothetical protein TorRG33x02_083660 [Trema orientale]|uniref:DUF1985 domain-containing protein n=1 Tax=Trema orientale TaxID=63057 RepID=A0A2P5FDG7_TREOI|nr:hypothetical protein TorRG33x02_083660 [Trema orientale]